MKIYYLRCPECGTLLGTVDERENIPESKCYWSILAIGVKKPNWRETNQVQCGNCNTVLTVYNTKRKPFIVRRQKK